MLLFEWLRVILTLEWPSNSLTVLASKPFSIQTVAYVWRSKWKLTFWKWTLTVLLSWLPTVRSEKNRCLLQKFIKLFKLTIFLFKLFDPLVCCLKLLCDSKWLSWCTWACICVYFPDPRLLHPRSQRPFGDAQLICCCLGANLLCELYCLLSLNCVDKSH